MLLAIDVGNTSIVFGVIKNKRIVGKFKIDTAQNPQDLKRASIKESKRIKRKYPSIECIMICSVVPKALKIILPVLKKELKVKSIVIGDHLIVPIKNGYRKPKQVGQDRLVCAYAAAKLYGTPAIIVDLGTAITIDVVSSKKEYLGGIIVPGIRLSADTLFQKAALLPKVNIEKPQTLIGKDTKGSILSGIFYGYGEMINGLVSLVTKQINGNPKVIITGGYTRLMRKYIQRKDKVIAEDLVLNGLDLLQDLK